MSTYHHILISSEDREDYTNTSPANCRINVPKMLNPTCMELAFAQFPNTYYNINSTNNAFSLNSTPMTVPAGCYSLTDLLQALANLMVSITPSITYDDITNLITIAASTTFTLDFSATNSIAPKIGYLYQVYSSAITYTAIYGPKLYDSALFININQMPAGCLTSNSLVPNVSFIVPNNVNKGEIIQFYAHTQFYLQPKVNTSDIQLLDIKILNDRGIQLQGLSNWVMALKVQQ